MTEIKPQGSYIIGILEETESGPKTGLKYTPNEPIKSPRVIVTHVGNFLRNSVSPGDIAVLPKMTLEQSKKYNNLLPDGKEVLVFQEMEVLWFEKLTEVEPQDRNI